MSDILFMTCEVIATLSIVSFAIGNFLHFNQVNTEIQNLNRKVHNLYKIQLSNNEEIECLRNKLTEIVKHPSEIELD